jgi:hypothetical protein
LRATRRGKGAIWDVSSVEQRVSLVALGVADLTRARFS